MTATLESLDLKIDAILRRLEAEQIKKQPNLTIIEFAQLAGVSRWTVQRYIKEGRIRKMAGRIPRDQLTKFTS